MRSSREDDGDDDAIGGDELDPQGFPFQLLADVPELWLADVITLANLFAINYLLFAGLYEAFA